MASEPINEPEAVTGNVSIINGWQLQAMQKLIKFFHHQQLDSSTAQLRLDI